MRSDQAVSGGGNTLSPTFGSKLDEPVELADVLATSIATSGENGKGRITSIISPSKAGRPQGGGVSSKRLRDVEPSSDAWGLSKARGSSRLRTSWLHSRGQLRETPLHLRRCQPHRRNPQAHRYGPPEHQVTKELLGHEFGEWVAPSERSTLSTNRPSRASPQPLLSRLKVVGINSVSTARGPSTTGRQLGPGRARAETTIRGVRCAPSPVVVADDRLKEKGLSRWRLWTSSAASLFLGRTLEILKQLPFVDLPDHRRVDAGQSIMAKLACIRRIDRFASAEISRQLRIEQFFHRW